MSVERIAVVRNALCEKIMKNFRPVVVLCYHNLAKPGEKGSWLKVDIEHFERHIVALKKIATFIRPKMLFEPSCLARGRINLLLTFDDGYANNFKLGLPVLQRHGVPALFFISTKNMETGEPFWFDRIIQLIQSYRLTRLDLRSLGMGIYHFRPKMDAERWSGIEALLEDVKKLDEQQDGQLVNRILTGPFSNHKGVDAVHEDDQPLNRDDALAMQRSGLCIFGGHGHGHRILTNLEDDSLKEELQNSRNILEELLGEPVDHISYPNGNVDSRVTEACRLAGYRFGYTTALGRVNHENDHYHIPRIMVSGFDTTASVLRLLARGLFFCGPKSK